MSEVSPTSSSNSNPIPLWAALSGHLTMGALKGIPVLLAIWLATFLTVVQKPDFSVLFGAVVLALVICEITATLVERPFVLKRQLSSPGGWDYVLLPWLAQLIVGYAAGFAVFGQVSTALALSLVLAIANAVEALLGQAWKPGVTQEEFAEQWDEFKDMTRETFAEDIQIIKHRAAEKQRRDHYRKQDGDKRD